MLSERETVRELKRTISRALPRKQEIALLLGFLFSDAIDCWHKDSSRLVVQPVNEESG